VAAIESYLGRTPLIADDVDAADDWQNRNTHLVSTRQRERLHVGAKFPWKGETVTVTSMGTDSATACSYAKEEYVRCELCNGYKSGGSNKLLHRYTITRDAIIAERAEQKRRKEIITEFQKLAADDGVRIDILNALKMPEDATAGDLNAVPLSKLEKVLAKFVKD
jgi:hypothetical protein